jgi:hypothetical protein
MRTRNLLPLLLLTTLAGAPASGPEATRTAATAPASAPAAARADLSTPQGAVIAFLNALQANDESAAHNAISFEGSADPKAPEAFLDILFSTNQIQQAAMTKFGDSAVAAFGDPKAALTARIAAVQKAAPAISNNDAALTLPSDENSQQPGTTIALKKTGNEWKIDAVSLFSLSALPPEDLAKRVALARKLIEINKDVAANITGGKYTSASEARQDLWDRSFEAAKSLTPAPATSPAPAAR